MTKDEWFQKCFDRFVERLVEIAFINEEFDIDTARPHIEHNVESCWEFELDSYKTEEKLLEECDPIEAADNELSCWGDDCG